MAGNATGKVDRIKDLWNDGKWSICGGDEIVNKEFQKYFEKVDE